MSPIAPGFRAAMPARAVETMLEVITSTLKRGDEVRLVGFGNFSVTRRKASTGRNPRTGEPMQIKATSPAQVPPRQDAQGRGPIDRLQVSRRWTRLAARL